MLTKEEMMSDIENAIDAKERNRSAMVMVFYEKEDGMIEGAIHFNQYSDFFLVDGVLAADKAKGFFASLDREEFTKQMKKHINERIEQYEGKKNEIFD